MSARAEELARRRRALQERCEQQRREMGLAASTLEGQLGTVDRGIDLMRRLTSSPIVIGAVFALVALVGPMRLFRWTGRALLLATAFKRLSRA